MSVILSIGTAVYNLDESFLRQHIEGVMSQLTDETELLLFDDCSKNDSGEICKEYAKKDSRIRYIRFTENGGLSVVRNRTIEEAKGKWIFFADGDDLLSRHAVETSLRFAETDYDVIIHERLRFTEGIPEEQPCEPAAGLTELPEGAGRTLSISCICMDPDLAGSAGLSKRAFHHAAWGALYRKDFLVKNRLLFPVGQKKAQDSVFNTEAYYRAEKIAFLPYVMYYYRENPDGITRRYVRDLPEIYAALLGLLKGQKERLFPGDDDIDARFRNHRVTVTALEIMRKNIFHKDNPEPRKQRKQEFLKLIETEPYREAIEQFDGYTYNRREWLLAVRLIRKKRFAILDRTMGNGKLFHYMSAAYWRLAALFR